MQSSIFDRTLQNLNGEAGMFEMHSKLPSFPGDLLVQPRGHFRPPIPIKTLWSAGPLVLVVLRRPGCFLCRTAAQKMMSIAKDIKSNGGTMVCILKSSLDSQEFVDLIWSEDIYYDYDLNIYNYIWNGEAKRVNLFKEAITPAFWKNVKNAKHNWKESNFVGEGYILGGVVVISTTGEVVYKFLEEISGDCPPTQGTKIQHRCFRCSHIATAL